MYPFLSQSIKSGKFTVAYNSRIFLHLYSHSQGLPNLPPGSLKAFGSKFSTSIVISTIVLAIIVKHVVKSLTTMEMIWKIQYNCKIFISTERFI